VAWLCRSLVLSGRAPEAWAAAEAHDASGAAGDAAGLLRGVGDDAYRTGQFLVAAQVSWGGGAAGRPRELFRVSAAADIAEP
jgi:hypothetical protein